MLTESNQQPELENNTSNLSPYEQWRRLPFGVRHPILFRILFAVPIILVAKISSTTALPFDVFGCWHGGIHVNRWLALCAPMIVWGVVIQSWMNHVRTKAILSGRPDVPDDPNPKAAWYFGLITGAWAAITEEIGIRWLLFYAGIPLLKTANFLFFEWAGFGIPKTLHLAWFGPIANFTTAGLMSNEILNHPGGWAVGASLIMTNAFFRDGHSYQGCLGRWNAWILGMCYFAMFLYHGLLAAIFAHFIYNATVAYVMVLGIESRQRRGIF